MAAHPDDLDELLDSALDDFQNLNLKPSKQKADERAGETGASFSSMPTNVQGLGLGLPDLGSKKKKGTKPQPSPDAYVSETLNKLREQTREAFRGLEESGVGGAAARSTAGVGGDGEDFNPEMLEEWVKQFEEFSGPQEMESLVESMMQRLLSKEILHDPLKEIAERYPKWLEDHKERLSTEDYERYTHQYEVMKELIGIYESDPDNFTKIVELMQKMQECGQPPNDIVQELTPDIDLAQLGQMSGGDPQNCSIM